jgi:MarR family transcriptional regulator, negative regulator of the multidrug operon emrRAB
MNERVANLLGAAALNVADLTLAEIRSAAGTSASASSALVVLAGAPDLSVTDLGRRIGLSQPAAARMIDALEDQGMVDRRRAAGRAVAVRLTAKGRRAANRLLERRGQILRELAAELDPDEQATLAVLLDKILRGVHARVGQGGAVPSERIGELVCRLCDRGACREGGAPCPVSSAQRDLDAQHASEG